MSSREAILESLRRNRPAPATLPELDCKWTTYENLRSKFAEVLEAVGGKAIVAKSVADLNDQLRNLPQVASAKKIASLVPGVGPASVDLSTIDSPHALADVDVAIISGEFAVAENAAVWITDRKVPQRVLYFLCQHLVLVVPASAIVSNMHDAYARIAESQTKIGAGHGTMHGSLNVPPFAEPYFSAFISGPSKTADIEQSLVIGAHGPRSLTVYLLDE